MHLSFLYFHAMYNFSLVLLEETMDGIYIVYLIFLIIAFYIGIIYFLHRMIVSKQGAHSSQSSQGSQGKCDAHSCKSIDPVSDPKYNMQQIVKQSILLEEHLANKNKRCRDCITKHFMHIIGLAEEAQMLATNNIDKYPLINESVELYNRLFTKWHKEYSSDGEKRYLDCCDELRTMRKKLIVQYFFDGM